jgi:hypothetical protein
LAHVQPLAFLADELFGVEGWVPWLHPPVAKHYLEDVGFGGFARLEAIDGRCTTGLIVVFDLLEEMGH